MIDCTSDSEILRVDNVTGGAAYVYDFDDIKETVTFVQKLTVEELDDYSSFGQSVAIGGDHIVIGAPYYDDDEFEQGAVFIYYNGSYVWDLFSPNPANDTYFGESVAINSNRVIAVGAPGDRNETGSVYIFKLRVQWELVFTIEPDVPEMSYAGWSVAIDEE